MKYITVTIDLCLSISIVICHFGYNKRDQHIWGQKYKECDGKMQSPISISSSKSVPLPLPAVEMIGYHNLLPGPLTLKNNGHSVAVRISSDLVKRRVPYVFGAVFKESQAYEMDHLHFHWGGKNDRGSEHTLNGIRYPMEMHIVHRNEAYSNFSTALNYHDGLAVLAVLFQLQEEDNELLRPVIKDLAGVQWLNKEIELNSSITLASLMPHNIDVFYTYKGSLTTPPCSEVVTWIIFPTPVPISFRQINKFRTLSSGKDILADNYRRLQHVGRRKVYVRRLSSSMLVKSNPILLNVSSLPWFWQ